MWSVVAERAAGCDDDACALEARRRARRPRRRAARSHRTLAWLGATSIGMLAQRLDAPRRAAVDHERRALRAPRLADRRSASSAPAWASSLTPSVGLEPLEQLLGAGPADRVAAAQPGQAPGLGERAEDQQRAGASSSSAQRRVDRLGVDEVDERLVERAPTTRSGSAREQRAELARPAM